MAKNPQSRSRSRGGRANPALRLQALRQLHLYLGVFFAPAILFFALTGALQVFSFHEAHAGYQPPPLLEKLGELHKKQRFALKPKRPQPARPATRPAQPEAARATPPATQALKWFSLAAAIGLMGTALLGLWMGLVYSANRGLAVLLLVAGIALPVLILMA